MYQVNLRGQPTRETSLLNDFENLMDYTIKPG